MVSVLVFLLLLIECRHTTSHASSLQLTQPVAAMLGAYDNIRFARVPCSMRVFAKHDASEVVNHCTDGDFSINLQELLSYHCHIKRHLRPSRTRKY
ncbi:hypothetical protein FA95DRAFT_484547 [Auriscalpium vulgare]|uniref:Uncharacterized protein n=1 Tax=Auriscalpium vulgare TaxID=40419 RepID=A0ACB8SCY7_9AGAM|nr:hypothetical protein FA95DRAFT_484547 [Auriscalpium vulgare]